MRMNEKSEREKKKRRKKSKPNTQPINVFAACSHACTWLAVLNDAWNE